MRSTQVEINMFMYLLCYLYRWSDWVICRTLTVSFLHPLSRHQLRQLIEWICLFPEDELAIEGLDRVKSGLYTYKIQRSGRAWRGRSTWHPWASMRWFATSHPEGHRKCIALFCRRTHERRCHIYRASRAGGILWCIAYDVTINFDADEDSKRNAHLW